MAILSPTVSESFDHNEHWGPTTKEYFNKFTTGTSMSYVHSSVIDALINNAIEKPIESSTITSPCIILVDSYGKATRAVAGTDYMSPNSNTTLGTNQTINLGETGYINGNGNGQFVTLTATTLNSTDIHSTTLDTTTIQTSTIIGTNGTNHNLDINTAYDSTTEKWTGTVTVGGSLHVNNQITSPMGVFTVTNATTRLETPLVSAATVSATTVSGTTGKFTNLILNGRSLATNAIATVCIASSQPTTDGTYNLWVNTTASSQILSYLSVSTNAAANSWVPLGAVFK